MTTPMTPHAAHAIFEALEARVRNNRARADAEVGGGLLDRPVPDVPQDHDLPLPGRQASDRRPDRIYILRRQARLDG
jgi:hypothetical protein